MVQKWQPSLWDSLVVFYYPFFYLDFLCFYCCSPEPFNPAVYLHCGFLSWNGILLGQLLSQVARHDLERVSVGCFEIFPLSSLRCSLLLPSAFFCSDTDCMHLGGQWFAPNFILRFVGMGLSCTCFKPCAQAVVLYRTNCPICFCLFVCLFFPICFYMRILEDSENILTPPSSPN